MLDIDNAMCHDITTDKFDIELQEFKMPNPKSRMTIGDLVIMNTKHFSWFHKLMWRIILGIKIEDIKEER